MAFGHKVKLAFIVGIFVFSALTFGVTFLTENNAIQEVNQTPEYELISTSVGNLSGTLSDNANTTDQQLERFDGNPFGILLNSVFLIGSTFTGVITGIFRIFIVLPSEILGIPPILTAVASSMLIIGIIFTRWRQVKS